MRRAAALFTLALAALGQPAPDADLLKAADNPAALADYIDTHLDFDWEPLWKAVGLKDAGLLACERSLACYTELLRVADPPQTILAIRMPAGNVAYIRYLGDDRTGWRLSGAYAATTRNYPPRQELAFIGARPFLRLSSQGVSGSDVSSEIEEWIDLSRTEFEPVFDFSPQGGERRFFGVGREIKSTARAKTNGAAETIEVNVDILFFGLAGLNRVHYLATYDRQPGQPKFELSGVKPVSSNAPTISIEEFKNLMDLDEGPSNEQLLRYAWPGLNRVARSGSAKAKDWLRKALDHCKDTEEKRALLALLSAP